MHKLQETDILQGRLMKAILSSIFHPLEAIYKYTGKAIHEYTKEKYQSAFNTYKIISCHILVVFKCKYKADKTPGL